MKHVGPKFIAERALFDNLGDGQWLRRVGDEIVGVDTTIVVEGGPLTALPEHHGCLFLIVNGDLILPETLPEGWTASARWLPDEGEFWPRIVGSLAKPLNNDGYDFVRVHPNREGQPIDLCVLPDSIRVEGSMSPAYPTRFFTAGGGASASSHEVTLPDNDDVGAIPGIEIVVVRTGGSSTTLDMSASGFTEIATRDSTGRTSIFARFNHGQHGTSATVSLGAARAVSWVAVLLVDISDGGSIEERVAALFADTNTLNPPELSVPDDWNRGAPLTAVSTRRSDNSFTAPEDYTLAVSGQSSAASSDTGDTRASLAESSFEAAFWEVDPGSWGSTGTTANVHAATLVVRYPSREELWPEDEGSGDEFPGTVYLETEATWGGVYLAYSGSPHRFVHQPGVQEIYEPLVLQGGHIYDFRGVILRQADGVNLDVMVTTPSYLDNEEFVDEPITVIGLTIDGNSANNTDGTTTGAIIRSYRTLMRDVTVRDVSGDGLVYSAESEDATLPTGTMVECVWDHCKVYMEENDTGACFKVQDGDGTAKATDGYMLNCIAFGGADNLLMEQAAGWAIQSFHGYAAHSYGIRVFKPYATRITDPYIEGFGQSASWRVGIWLVDVGSRGASIIGGTVSTDQTTGTSIGIMVENANGVESECTITAVVRLTGDGGATETAFVLDGGSGGLMKVNMTGAVAALYDTLMSRTGSLMIHSADLMVTSQGDATYTLQPYDANQMVQTTRATSCEVLVPANSSVPFPIGTVVAVVQMGAGDLYIGSPSGVTINGLNGDGTGTFQLAHQYAAVTLLKVDTDAWVLNGPIAV